MQEYNSDEKKQQSVEVSQSSRGAGVRRVSVQPEDSTLQEADLDDLNSHRSEDPRGMRRFKVQPTSIQKKEGEQYKQNILNSNKKSNYDHSPHEIFVQLDELQGLGEDREWKETARWIKYEEGGFN